MSLLDNLFSFSTQVIYYFNQALYKLERTVTYT
jgi:hypothetical protein